MLSSLASAKKHSNLTQLIAWSPSSMMPQALGLPTLLHTPNNSPHMAVSSLALTEGKELVGWAG